jgi:hypothetical protein
LTVVGPLGGGAWFKPSGALREVDPKGDL